MISNKREPLEAVVAKVELHPIGSRERYIDDMFFAGVGYQAMINRVEKSFKAEGAKGVVDRHLSHLAKEHNVDLELRTVTEPTS